MYYAPSMREYVLFKISTIMLHYVRHDMIFIMVNNMVILGPCTELYDLGYINDQCIKIV